MEPTAASTSSTDPERVPVGRIVGAHGMRGQLRLQCFTDTPDALAALTRIWIDGPGPDRAERGYRVASCAPGRSGELRVALAGVEGRAAAEALVGRTALAAVGELPPAGEGSVYAFELLGFRALSAEGRELGRVQGLWNTGAPAVLMLRAEGGREHLVPSALLVEIDFAARRVVVDAIPGLIDGAA